MGPAGSEPEEYIARDRAASVDDGVVLDHADAETREIVVGVRVHARHLRGLAADEGHASQFAAARDTLDDPVRDLLVEPTGGKVVEKIQRLGALNDDVVGAHGDQIDADPMVVAGVDGEPQLGADAIGSRDQDRSAIAIHG